MLRYEKEMIPVLRNSLSRLFQTNYFIEEFASGFGIADLVFVRDLVQRQHVLDDFEAMYYLDRYFNADQTFCIDGTIKKYALNKQKAFRTVAFLKQLNLVRENEAGVFTRQDVYSPGTSEIIAIEAKLKDWKAGLHQALRYKLFAQKTFLAIDADYMHRIDLHLLKEQNVGLMAVDPQKATIVFDPSIENPQNKTAFYCFSERFVSHFSHTNV